MRAFGVLVGPSAAFLLAGCAMPKAGIMPTATSAQECVDCPTMVVIPAGSFEMGGDVDRGYGKMDGPAHTVTIPKPFALAAHEVTVGDFRKFVAATGYISEGKCNIYEEGTSWHIDPHRNWASPGFPQGENHPVVCVSWEDAQAYAAWLRNRTGKAYRLPSEAEWEYVAAVADIGGESAGGKVGHSVANMGREECCGGKVEGADGWMYTAPVGSFPADRFGIYDLRGNAWEWQADCYNVDYANAPTDGSARTANCSEPDWRVVRGGSYGDAGEFFERRFRLRGRKHQAYFTLGFRLAASIP